jgi:hypothetical protein
MAHTLTDLALTATERYYNKIGASVGAFEKFVPVKRDQREQTSYKPVDLSGLGVYTAQAADGATPTADEIQSIGSAYTAPPFEKRVVFTDYQLAKNPGLFNEVADMAADAAIATINTLVMGSIAVLDTLAHPSATAGSYTATGGGTVYYADDFATPVAQVNLGTAVLSTASLLTNKSILRNYKNRDGRVMDYASDPLVIVCDGTEYDLAKDLQGRTVEVAQATGTLGSTGSGIADVIATSEFAGGNDWLLASATRFPVGLWLPLAPNFRIDTAVGAGRSEMYSSYEAGVFYRPFEGGFVLNTP